MKSFLEVFIPLFIAMDPVGLLPVFLGVTGELVERRRRRVAAEAVISAGVICLVFMFVGQRLFDILGIRSEHFMIGGGIILLVLAVLDIVIIGKPAMDPEQVQGVVPLGMPMIAGPATLSTILVLASNPRFGYSWTALGLATNLAILLASLHFASAIGRWVGANALRAVSKIIMVLLAALAVSFITEGIRKVMK